LNQLNKLIQNKKMKKNELSTYCNADNSFEIGIDEAGRGPLFGRLYVAAVVLSKVGFRHEDMKDSKKFHSKKKIQNVAEYIKKNAIAWSVQYIEVSTIDEINIRQSVFKGMHECIRDILSKLQEKEFINKDEILLLVDGNDFKPFTFYDEDVEEIRSLRHETIEKGDNKYTCIAAASILAKVERDQYIAELCEKNPELSEKYGINTNMGYGTKVHMDGIKQYGITEWHRKSFAPCRGTYG
jgi:ribonuclease HII